MNNEQLIDDMIQENPDYTIKDYLELRDEITAIRKSAHKHDMMKYGELLEAIDKTLAA